MRHLRMSAGMGMLSREGRRPGGPTTGAAVRSRLALMEPGDGLGSREHLFRAVLSADPTYLPGVAADDVSFGAWYRRKAPSWVRVATTPASAPHLVGHVGVRLNGLLPDGRLLEEAGMPRLAWELGMLVVRPGFRGCGIATDLVAAATHANGQPLWSVVHAGSPGYFLMSGLGWNEVGTTSWRDDPVPGVVMVSR